MRQTDFPIRGSLICEQIILDHKTFTSIQLTITTQIFTTNTAHSFKTYISKSFPSQTHYTRYQLHVICVVTFKTSGLYSQYSFHTVCCMNYSFIPGRCNSFLFCSKVHQISSRAHQLSYSVSTKGKGATVRSGLTCAFKTQSGFTILLNLFCVPSNVHRWHDDIYPW